jgi:acyl-CoA hydrolase
VSKIVDKCPEGITTTAIAADQVIIVTEYGVFDSRGLSFSERVAGIAHLAKPVTRKKLLARIYDSRKIHGAEKALREAAPAGFTPYEAL